MGQAQKTRRDRNTKRRNTRSTYGHFNLLFDFNIRLDTISYLFSYSLFPIPPLLFLSTTTIMLSTLPISLHSYISSWDIFWSPWRSIYFDFDSRFLILESFKLYSYLSFYPTQAILALMYSFHRFRSRGTHILSVHFVDTFNYSLTRHSFQRRPSRQSHPRSASLSSTSKQDPPTPQRSHSHGEHDTSPARCTSSTVPRAPR